MILAAGQFSSKFLVYVMMRFYTGELGTSGYGAMGIIVDASVIIMAVVTLSVNDSVIRFGLDKKYDKSQVFSIGLLTTVIGVLMFAAVAPALTLIDLLKDYALLIYLYVFTGSIKSCCALFARSAGYVRLYALDGIFTTVVNIIFNFIFMLGFNMGVTGYVLSVVVADAASIVFVFYMADLKRYFRLWGLNKHLRRSMYRFSLPLIPTTVMWWVTNASDGFIIAEILGEHYTGLYKVAYRIPNIIVLISLIFSQAWNMSAITEKNSRTISQFYTNVFNIFQSAIYIMAAGILLLIKPALDVMTSEDFAGVYRYSPLLVVAVVFACFSTFMGSVYVASKKTVRSMLTAFGGAVSNIILNFLLIPVMGIQGAALATVISYLIIFAARAVDTRKIVLMDLKLPKITLNMVIIAAMGMVVIFAENITFFYISLSAGFLLTTVFNFRAGVAAIYMLKRKKE
jgi:O-antigen/teichoic acid export membrane protein